MSLANPHVDHESSDINIRGVVAAAIGLVLVTLLAAGGVAALFLLLSRTAARTEGPSPTRATLPPEPRLQPDPENALRQMRTEESRILNDYRWVDKDAGIARIPIDRAMKLVLERDLLTPKPSEAPKETPTGQQPADGTAAGGKP